MPALPAALLLICTGCGIFGPKKVQQEAVLPQDRENIAVKPDAKLYAPEEIKRGVVKGDWAIETVYGKDAVGEKAPFLKFVASDKRVYGNNGCNVINAAYSYNPADSTISFGDLASTMMMCHKEGLTDYEINTALGAVKYYSWTVEDSNYYLFFYDETRREVMKLMHQNFQFLNGTWRVTRIGEKAVDVPDMKMVFDVDEGKVHGNSISISALGVTRMACPDQNYETLFLVALEEVSAAKPVSSTEVILYDSQQKEVMRLQRAVAKAEK